jgi:glycopeptide antibiotics resistance protein
MSLGAATPLLGLLQPHANDAAVAGLAAAGCMVWLVVLLAMVLFPIFCFWRIFAKAGFNGAMALLCLIPGIGMIIVLCILAFGTWPAGQRG